MRISSEIACRAGESIGVVAKQADDAIAHLAEQATHMRRTMTVVDIKETPSLTRRLRLTNRAAPMLLVQDAVVVRDGQAIPSQLSPANGLWIAFREGARVGAMFFAMLLAPGLRSRPHHVGIRIIASLPRRVAAVAVLQRPRLRSFLNLFAMCQVVGVGPAASRTESLVLTCRQKARLTVRTCWSEHPAWYHFNALSI